MFIDQASACRLFQLISPSLPTGAFSYSQGLEWAVACGWVHDRGSLVGWLESILHCGHRELEIPLLKRLYLAAREEDLARFGDWCDYLVACRETFELREEERNRGRALARLLAELFEEIEPVWLDVARDSQAAGFALASARADVGLEFAALGYLWSWLENMVMAAVKIVPLGQTAGQQVLLALSPSCRRAVEAGLRLEDGEIAGSSPLLALGSCLHETQYSRLFRS